MKNIIAIVAAILIISTINAQESKEPSTMFDQVLLQKGSLIIKEFFPFGNFNKIQGEIAVLTDVNTGNKTYALRVTSSYYNSQYDNGEVSAIFDAKEINSAIESLEFMLKRINEITDSAPYTEIIYRGNGEPQFGFYVSGKDKKGFFKLNYKVSVYFEVYQLIQLKTFFESAKSKITELGGSIN